MKTWTCTGNLNFGVFWIRLATFRKSKAKKNIKAKGDLKLKKN